MKLFGRSFCGLLFLGGAPLFAQLQSIPISTAPYTHNMTVGQTVYAGDFILHGQNWGVYGVNAKTGGSFRMVSPVTNKAPNTQPATLTRCDGDFHQSMQFLFASPKWAVTTINSLGTHFGCTPVVNPSKVQVYAIGPGGISYAGDAFADSFGSLTSIVGDMAYIDRGNGTFAPVNLTTCTPGASGTCTVGAPIAASSVPPSVKQTSIDGFTYDISVVDSQHFLFLRKGGGTPTPTATAIPPTATPTPTPPSGPHQFDDWIYQWVCQGYSAGCAPGYYCPDRPLTRGEMAVFGLKILYGPDYVPPPCATPGTFVDVPCK